MLAWGLIVMLTGGIDARIGGLVIRSRDPFRAVVAGLTLLLLHLVLSPAGLRGATDRLSALCAPAAPAIAAAAAVLLLIHALTNGAFVAGSADAYGYVNQAHGWARGALPGGESLPISVIGTGPDLNSATDNGLRRAAELLGLSVPEVMNRATIAGAIEIGRAPGVVHVTFRAPASALEAAGLKSYAEELYA